MGVCPESKRLLKADFPLFTLFCPTPRSDRVLKNLSFFYSQVVFIIVHLDLNGQNVT